MIRRYGQHELGNASVANPMLSDQLLRSGLGVLIWHNLFGLADAEHNVYSL